MSQWTHVNSSIRIDGIFHGMFPALEELGKVCKFDDDNRDHWDTTPLPCGSEGSLEYQVWMNPNQSSLAKMVINWWGDLRDYSNHDEILNYFKSITKGRMIRSGILEIDIEYQETYVYRYSIDNQDWKLLKTK